MPSNIHNSPSDRTGQEIYAGLKVNLTPAPFEKRALAYIVDLSIISVVTYVVMMLSFVIFGVLMGGMAYLQANLHEKTALIFLIVIATLFVLGGLLLFDGYFIYFEYKRGSTPGKKIFGLSVIPLKTRRLTLGQCVLREAFRHIDALFGIFAVPGIIAVNANDKHQRIGDLIAGTMVVYSNYKVKQAQCMYLGWNDWAHVLEQVGDVRVAPSLRTQYLAFAYPTFVMRKLHPREETFAQWERKISEQLPRLASLDIPRELKLRFFAELCLRQTNETK